MRILLLGDASNFHNTLAGALRKLGNEVILASHGSRWMNTRRDINLYRKPGKSGTFNYALKLLATLPSLRGYDIVQVTNPIFLDLRPEKVSYIFDYLKRHNGKVIYEALGTDCNYVKECVKGTTFKYSDYRIGNEQSQYSLEFPENEAAWLAPKMEKYTDYFINKVDGVAACLYEYYKTYEQIVPSKLTYCGIPIDVDLDAKPISEDLEKVKFFIGIQKSRSVLKGTDIILDALKKVVAKYPDKSEICVAENLPYDEYIKELASSHVLLDQLYSYTPATNALLAMSRGLIAVSGAEPEYYDFIGETENRPIINISPLELNDIETKLEWIILNKSQLPKLSRMSIDFVRKHNDSAKIAQKHIDFWQKI